MKIVKKQTEHALEIAVAGRIDTNTAPDLEKELVWDNDITDFVFDLKDVEYISSAGLRVFLKAQKDMEKKKGAFKIINAKSSVKELFNIVGFNTIMNIK